MRLATPSPEPPEWRHELQYRRGSPSRLRGVHVFHDFDWLSRFPDKRAQFQGGQSLADVAIEECPDGKEPALLLTQDMAASESPVQSDVVYAVVTRIDEYLIHKANDRATSYYAERSSARITSLAEIRSAPNLPEVFGELVDERLTVDQVVEWAEADTARLKALVEALPVTSPSEHVAVFDDATKAAVIRGLLQHGHSEEFWNALTRENPDLATQLAAAQVELARREVVAEYRQSIDERPTDERLWQSFFEANPWILQFAFAIPVFKLGNETYLGGKEAAGPQGQGGVATDFLFSDDSTKGFAVVELKTPSTALVGARYRGASSAGTSQEVYSASADLSGAIVQARNQIAVAMNDFEAVLGRTYEDMKRVHATGVLIVGLARDLSERQLESFNLLRRGIHDLTIVTFDELLIRLTHLFRDSEMINEREGALGL